MDFDLLQGFYLRDLLVIPPKGEISGGAGAVHLPPESMEVLLCLASNAGELVTCETLIDAVWGEGLGSQEALNHAVSEIRHALNDPADNPQFVQTLPTRGYRLIVEPFAQSAHTSSVVLGSTGALNVGDIGLFENLKRRGVLETAIAYLIFGWLIIQIADIVFDQLLLPPWAGTFVTVLVIAGFPIAIALSWFLEFRDGRAVLDELSPMAARRRQFSRTYLSVIGAMAIAGIAVFIYDRSIGLPEAPVTEIAAPTEASVLPPILDNTIAVLPFLNVDRSEETEVFANGLADDVITRLSRVPGLLVASRGDSFDLDPNTPSQRVRERLRVARYIEGSVQLAGNEMRIIMQLIDSETGFHVLSRTFDRPREDFFDVRDEITELTVANVRVTLPPETQAASIISTGEPDLDAYILYRQGKELYERPRTLDTVAKVIGFYQQALELDQDYAAAHAGLCNVYVVKYHLSDSNEDIERAENACAAALTSNPHLHMVYTALGELFRHMGRLSEAEKAYEQALQINSKDAHAMSGLAAVYRLQQRSNEAERLLHTAIAIQPGSWRSINSLGAFYFNLGRYDEAATAYRQVIAIDPENYQVRTNLGSALTMAGSFEAGIEVFEEALDIHPSDTAHSNLGVIYYYLGDYQQSVEAHRQAIELKPSDPLNSLNLADALYFAGDIEASRKMFELAAELSQKRLIYFQKDLETILVQAWSRQMLGDNIGAQESLSKGFEIAPTNPYVFYYAALIETQLGNHSAAVKSLEAAVGNGYPVAMVAAEPYLQALRYIADFQALIAGHD